MAIEAAERKATTVRAGASRAYREVEATTILAYHVLDLLLSHHARRGRGEREASLKRDTPELRSLPPPGVPGMHPPEPWSLSFPLYGHRS